MAAIEYSLGRIHQKTARHATLCVCLHFLQGAHIFFIMEERDDLTKHLYVVKHENGDIIGIFSNQDYAMQVANELHQKTHVPAWISMWMDKTFGTVLTAPEDGVFGEFYVLECILDEDGSNKWLSKH